jgi:hypothetical protein
MVSKFGECFRLASGNKAGSNAQFAFAFPLPDRKRIRRGNRRLCWDICAFIHRTRSRNYSRAIRPKNEWSRQKEQKLSKPVSPLVITLLPRANGSFSAGYLRLSRR